MSVVLYKPGNSHTIRDIRCNILICDEYSYLHNLDNGWFSSPGECYAKTDEDSDEEKAKKEADEKAESERQALLEKAREYDLKPHPKTGIPKLTTLIADHEHFQAIEYIKAAEPNLDIGDLGYDAMKALAYELKEKENAE